MSLSTYSQRYATSDSNTAGAFAFDTISSTDYSIGKLAFGSIGSVTLVSAADPLPVTVISSALPTGAASAANQAAGNVSLASIDSKAPTLGQALAAASVPVVLPAAQVSTLTPLSTVNATQSGTWTVQPGNTANTTAWKVDGSAVTQPVSGAVTANAGTGTFTVGGTVTANAGTGTFTVDSELPAAAAISGENNAAPTAPSVYTFQLVYDGTNWDRMPGTSADGVTVNLGTNNDVTIATLPALAAGTNNIGDVDVASIAAGDAVIGRVKLSDGTDVADILDLTNSNPLAVAIVDGSGTQLVSFGGGAQYTEADTDATITGTAILWEDASDTLRAVSSAKPLPVNIISGAGSGGTASADDADFTAGATNGTPAMGVYESIPTAVTDGDLGTVGITQGRRLKTSATIDAALPAGTNNIGDVDVLTLPAIPAGTNNIGDVDIASIAAGDNNIGNVDIVTMPNVTLAAGTNTNEVVGDAAHDAVAAGNPVLVGGYSSATAPGDVSADGDAVRAWYLRSGAQAVQPVFAGTLASTGNGSSGGGVLRVAQVSDGTGTIATVSTVTSLTGSAVAHDATDSGNPHKVGGVARTSNPTAVADGDRVNASFDDLGRQLVRAGQARDLVTHAYTTISSSTAETTVLAAGGAGVFHDLTTVLAINTSATAVRLDFKDATSGTIRFAIYVPAGETRGFTPQRPVTQASANGNWTATCSASVADVRIFVMADKEV